MMKPITSRRHGDLIPNSIRAIVCGPSGCGKTNLMLNLIFDKNGLNFENIYIYSKSLHQPKYEFLEMIMKQLPEIGLYRFIDNDAVIDPSEAKQNSIFIFDDVACDKQDKIRSFFCMGRHNNIDSFYLTQTYTRIPKHLIRDNANVLILFKQDEVNLKHMYDEHVNTDMKFDVFKDAFKRCWNDDKYNPMIIMKDFEVKDGRYRIGMDKFIYPD
ncbi:uncharacterized protein [Onthophagus taurus]|uniref:uncharacterized protein n=1 Tax=Onthophagus taurus TaxID=166361 RepID=UPI0039BE396A